MPLFTSKRERHLWLWTMAIVLAIYSTLGLASLLAKKLREFGMNDDLAAVGFLFGMFLVGLTILLQGLKVRPRGIDLAVATGIAAVYYMVFFRLTLSERSHIIEYSVVAVFIYEALLERASQGRRVPIPALLAILATSLIGVIDECIQLLLPSRVFDPTDMFFNFLAALLGVGSSAGLSWVRKRFGGEGRSRVD